MPADRKHHTRLDWQLDLPQQQKPICFAPNLTPVTFESPPPLVDAPLESVLFPPSAPSTSQSAPSKRSNHGKKRPLDHIPRPPNAFILFRTSFVKHQHVPGKVEGNHSTLSKIIGLCWQNLPYEERQVWQARAKAALAEHKRKYPEYSFKPAAKDKDKDTVPAPPSLSAKRRVRETERPDQQRCEKIADLLVQGKKGVELQHALDAFDRDRPRPTIEARFEAPITATHFRKVSSNLSNTDPRPLKRQRSASARPEEIPSPAASWDSEISSPEDTSSCATPDASVFSFDLGSSELDYSAFSFENSSLESLPQLSHSGMSRTSSFESLGSPLTPTSSYESLSPPTPLSAQSSWSEYDYQYSNPASPLSYAPSPTEYSPTEYTSTPLPAPIPSKSLPSHLSFDAPLYDPRRPSIIVAEQLEQWTRANPGASLEQLVQNVQPTAPFELDLYAAGLDSFTDPFSYDLSSNSGLLIGH